MPIVVNMGDCCCGEGSGSGGGSGDTFDCGGGITIPGSVTLTWHNISEDPTTGCQDPCRLDLITAPVTNGTGYVLARCCSSPLDDPGCTAAEPCGACYRYGNLTQCEVADLYGLEADLDPCSACPETETACSVKYTFVNSYDCGGGITRDYYLGLTCCLSVTGSDIFATVCLYWIVVDPNFPSLSSGGGLWSDPFPLVVTPGSCDVNAVANTCNPLGETVPTAFSPCVSRTETGPLPITMTGASDCCTDGGNITIMISA